MGLAMINATAVNVHLLCLGLSILVAMMADIRASRAVFRPLTRNDLSLLKRYHKLISLGLLMCWVSGLVLIWLRTGFVAENFSPKLMMKIAVVVALSVTAVFMGRIGLPTMQHFQGETFGKLPLTVRVKLTALAGMSASGWSSAFLLGAVPAFKTMQWAELGEVFGSLYLAILTAAIFVALIAPIFSFVRGGKLRDPRFETPVQRTLSQL